LRASPLSPSSGCRRKEHHELALKSPAEEQLLKSIELRTADEGQLAHIYYVCRFCGYWSRFHWRFYASVFAFPIALQCKSTLWQIANAKKYAKPTRKNIKLCRKLLLLEIVLDEHFFHPPPPS
jgi:hypothetical protein